MPTKVIDKVKLDTRGSDISKQYPSLDVFENFPRGEGERGVLAFNLGVANGPLRRIADIGGGANPLIDASLIEEHGIEYSMLDISRIELDKAPEHYHKIQVDVTVALDEFSAKVGKEKFDLVCSRDFLEHVRDPIRVHENIYSALRPGGLAVHFYPSPHCIPLFVNRLLPDWFTQPLLRIAQPHRDLVGYGRKFPAYYAMCGAPSERLKNQYRQLGFDVIRHTGFIGHDYYARFPVAREIERWLRPVLRKAGLPLISRSVLVLRKN
jgi:SAM-dependent methyltransferase